MRITVVGMGNMGRAFAARALGKSHQVTIWNRTPGRAADLTADGALEAASPRAAVTGADAVLVVLADDDAVLDVCLGDGGVLSALGTTTIFANVSTVSPDTARRLAAHGPDGRVLDTPVMGSPAAIAGGSGRFFIGGALSTITAADALWKDLGSGYIHCGPVGSGATMKLVSNLLLITGVVALAEGIATARGHGIPEALLRDLFAESPVVSPASRVRLTSLLDDDHPGWFSPSLARKDVRLAVELAERAGIELHVRTGSRIPLDRPHRRRRAVARFFGRDRGAALNRRARGPAPGTGWGDRSALSHASPAVTALSSSSDSRISCGKSRSLLSSTQRSNATLNTAIPASAVRLAAGSVTPRRRSASASAEASDASLISSRSRSSAFAAMTAWRCRGEVAALLEQSAGSLEARPRRRRSAPRRRVRRRRRSPGAPAATPAPPNSTSRLSAKWRKNVRSVRPARSAISATVVSLEARARRRGRAPRCSSRPRLSGSHRVMARS